MQTSDNPITQSLFLSHQKTRSPQIYLPTQLTIPTYAPPNISSMTTSPSPHIQSPLI